MYSLYDGPYRYECMTKCMEVAGEAHEKVPPSGSDTWGNFVNKASEVEVYFNRTVVAAEYLVMDGSFFEPWSQPIGDEKVVDAPAGVLLAGAEAVAPPAVFDGLGIEVAERICEAIAEQLGHLGPLFVCESGVAAVGLGVLEVYFLVRHVHIAAYDDGLSGVESVQIGLKVVFPRHAIVESSQTVLRIRRVNIDEIEVFVFKRDDATFVVVLVDADAISHRKRLLSGIDGRAAVAFLVGIVPKRSVAGELKVELSGLHLGLLKAEEVGIERFKCLREVFRDAGT